MDGLKIGAIILGIGLLTTTGFAVIMQLNNTNLNEDLYSLKDSLTASNAELNSTRLILQQSEQELNNSQLFILTNMKAIGAHNYAWEEDNDSVSKCNIAIDYYINDSWDNAILYFTESKNGYESASQKWIDAALLYKDIGTYTNNITYQNYFDLYYESLKAYSSSSTHSSNYMNYMAIACGYYKSGDYTTGNNNFDKGSIEYDKSIEEIIKGTEYKNDADNLLTELYAK